MGVLKRPKYQETETDKMIKRQLAEEQKERIEKEEKRAERKKRIAGGLVGSRALFSRAGGRGFYDDEGNMY
tara:strand:- start:5592 stop:5804 length:213 start_codon:yes stop_codon:yes gene_type:complete